MCALACSTCSLTMWSGPEGMLSLHRSSRTQGIRHSSILGLQRKCCHHSRLGFSLEPELWLEAQLHSQWCWIPVSLKFSVQPCELHPGPAYRRLHVRHFVAPCRYYVDWGDGTSSQGYQDHLGPFQVAHQYPKYCASYGVTAYYCSTPKSCCCSKRCCSTLYRVIDVSYDPQDCRCNGWRLIEPLCIAMCEQLIKLFEYFAKKLLWTAIIISLYR